MTSKIALILLFVALVTAAAAPSDEGIALGRLREVRVTGRVFDAKTGEPLADALVTVEGPYQNHRAKTGPDGTYYLAATSEGEFGTVSIAFAHADYQQKYLETLFRGAFPKKVDVTVEGNGMRVRTKGVDVVVACGAKVDVAMRSGSASFVAVCEEGERGFAVEMRGNRIAVSADRPFAARIENGKLEIREVDGVLALRVDAAMLRR